MSAERPPPNKKNPTPRDKSLEDRTEETAEVMARARKEVNRARATLHDQIMPASQDVERPDPEE